MKSTILQNNVYALNIKEKKMWVFYLTRLGCSQQYIYVMSMVWIISGHTILSVAKACLIIQLIKDVLERWNQGK